MSTSIDDIPKPRMTPRALLRSILMLDDTPHSIALGTAIGMFIGMTPTVGIQMMIVLVIAFLTRPLFTFNKIAAVLTVYVTNPLTLVPIYWFNYKVGTCFIPSSVTYEDFVTIIRFDRHHNWSKQALSLITELGAPLLVGCLLVAIVSSVLTYPAMRWLLQRSHRTEVTASDQQSDQQPVDSK
ncbi:MAG: DUF2062 domain-containing protein [Rhodopirellula sp.]|nr:DUF2062 domain-containing protein [Rhodopirellula sp.]